MTETAPATIQAPAEIGDKAVEVPAVDSSDAEGRYLAAQEAWFHEIGRQIGLAAPVYQDYEDDPELGKPAA